MRLVLPGIWKRDFVKTKHLPVTSAVSLALVDFIHILKAFYHPHVSLVLFPPSLVDASQYAQVGLSYTMN